MKNRTCITGLLVVCSLALAVVLVPGCKEEAAPGPGTAAAAVVVNDRCPIMGNKIDPAKVPADLIVDFGGKKVGFCCAGCPAAWNKLDDAKKKEALDKVLAAIEKATP